MTRDEHRAKCIEAMKISFFRQEVNCERAGKQTWDGVFANVFDALNGLARVNPIEATEEMIDIAQLNIPSPYKIDIEDRAAYATMVKAILTAGDLTNPPEETPK